MKVLFICTANRMRSLTAEEEARKMYPDHEFKSCGTSKAKARVFMTDDLLRWADHVIFMADTNYAYAVKNNREALNSAKTVRIMGLLDQYKYRDPRFIQLFRTTFPDYMATYAVIQ